MKGHQLDFVYNGMRAILGMSGESKEREEITVGLVISVRLLDGTQRRYNSRDNVETMKTGEWVEM